MSPVKSAFQERLEIYQQQKEEVAKDAGRTAQLKKRRADFGQQRAINYQQVENISSTTRELGSVGPRLAANTLSTGAGQIGNQKPDAGRSGAEAFKNVKASASDTLNKRAPSRPGASVTTGGEQRLLSPRLEWRTSGYQASVVPTPPQGGLAATPDPAAEPKKKKVSIKSLWEMRHQDGQVATLGSTLAMRTAS